MKISQQTIKVKELCTNLSTHGVIQNMYHMSANDKGANFIGNKQINTYSSQLYILVHISY